MSAAVALDYPDSHYDPQVGRFVQKDPIGLAAGDTNLYRYVSNEPIKNNDPLGLLINDRTGVVGLLLNTGDPRIFNMLNELHQSSFQVNIINVNNLRSDEGTPLYGQANTPTLPSGYVDVSIDVNRNISSRRGIVELADTALHELIHVHHAVNNVLQGIGVYDYEEYVTQKKTNEELRGNFQCQ